MLRDFDILELQADELCTFIGSKSRTIWLFAAIEVWSRLWASSVLGRRSYRHTKAVINDVLLRGRLVGSPLIATDGFEYYVGVIARFFSMVKCIRLGGTIMNWSDIFTAPAPLSVFFVAVVRIPVTVQRMKTSAAALPTFSWPHQPRSVA